MINDELKRRMTASQGGLTPRTQRKGELCDVKTWVSESGSIGPRALSV